MKTRSCKLSQSDAKEQQVPFTCKLSYLSGLGKCAIFGLGSSDLGFWNAKAKGLRPKAKIKTNGQRPYRTNFPKASLIIPATLPPSIE
jgi:hypothetical protein